MELKVIFCRNLVEGLDISSVLAPAFVNCRNLKRLLICVNNGPSFALEAVKICLRSNPELKELRIFNGQVIGEILPTDVSFKLSGLELDNYSDDPQNIQNVKAFLKTQVDYLEELYFGRNTDVETMKIILSMPRLKSLTLKLSIEGKEALESLKALPPSNSIEFLDSLYILPCMLKAFPKVQTLITDSLDFYSVEFIPKAFKSLRNLSASMFRAKKVSNKAFYKGLEKFTCREVGELFLNFEAEPDGPLLVKNESIQKLFEKLNGKIESKK